MICFASSFPAGADLQDGQHVVESDHYDFTMSERAWYGPHDYEFVDEDTREERLAKGLAYIPASRVLFWDEAPLQRVQ